MGDDCNVASRRSEDSPSSSSPTLVARIKNPEDSRVGDIPVEDRDFLHLARQSGEPGEEMYKISDNKHIVENDLSQPDELAVTEPLLFVHPSLAQSTISVFPYFDTKLRPDAPPFMPESLTRGGPTSCEIVEINDTICLEPSLVPRAMIDDSCFVNIELRSSSLDNVTSSSTPEMEKHLVTEKRKRDFRETIKEPELKTFSVTSTPRTKDSMPEIESSIVEFSASVANDECIVVAATESVPNETNADETSPVTGEPRIVRGYWRILRTACILSNRIQIVVFIASLVICMILVIYVVV